MKKKYIVTAVAVLVIALVAGVSYYASILNVPPSVQPSNVVVALDDSMSPLIEKDAKVTFDKNVKYSDLHVNDVVVFHKSHEPQSYIGRVANVTTYGLIIKGDNNPSVYPEYIKEAYYVGKVTTIENPP